MAKTKPKTTPTPTADTTADQDAQSFLRDLDKRLWDTANKLRSNLDAAVYKHAVLGLVFLKYVSDAFAARQAEIQAQLRDPNSDYFLDPADYSTGEDGVDSAEYTEAIHAELEDRDYYAEKNVFWVPALARWKTLQNAAKLPAGTELEIVNGKKSVYKITSTGRLIDDALDAIEKQNPRLKNVLNKTYTQLQIDPANLAGLIDLIATIPFEHADLHAKDILGHVYEYFLGQFALAEGKKGGQYFTPKSIVNLIVQMLQPYEGRVYDPAMGSGGFFVSSEKFIKQHGGKLGNISVYGQESNPTTWRLAAMNMAIRGIDFNFGKEPANTFTSNQHPDLRADYVMANPPFNIKDWWEGKLENDPRWVHGTPPQGNANFAWLQHMLHHLAPKGTMALLLANGSMSSNSGGEGDIRKALVEADLIECMVALPGQLFTNTQIPACIWFLTKDKKKSGSKRNRKGEVLFIDARQTGHMADRVLRVFSDDDLTKLSRAYHHWQQGPTVEEANKVVANNGIPDQDGIVTMADPFPPFMDQPGYCKSATLEEITGHGYVLTPGRYVEAEEIEDDGEPFEEKMARLTEELRGQFAESRRLETVIDEALGGLGYGE